VHVYGVGSGAACRFPELFTTSAQSSRCRLGFINHCLAARRPDLLGHSLLHGRGRDQESRAVARVLVRGRDLGGDLPAGVPRWVCGDGTAACATEPPSALSATTEAGMASFGR
jgi:hypothetical protein